MDRLPGGRSGAECRRILIVDDCEDAADSLSLILSQEGWTAKVAYDARSALAVLDEFTPDVVFLDLVMSGMDGIALARRIRAHKAGRYARLIALSGWPHDERCACGRDGGIEMHLVKPVSIKKIIQVLTGENR